MTGEGKLFLGFGFWGVLFGIGLAGELLAEFLAGVTGEDFFYPADFGGLVFAG